MQTHQSAASSPGLAAFDDAGVLFIVAIAIAIVLTTLLRETGEASPAPP